MAVRPFTREKEVASDPADSLGSCVLTIHKKCRGYAFKHKEKSIFAKSGWQITPPESFCYGKW